MKKLKKWLFPERLLKARKLGLNAEAKDWKDSIYEALVWALS